MKNYVDKDKLQEFTTKLTAKFKTVFALKGETATDEQVAMAVSAWLADHVDPETGYVIDDTLTIEGAAADAKAVGDGIAELQSAVNNISKNQSEYIPSAIGGTSKIINYSTGKVGTGNTYYAYTDYVDVSRFSIIAYKRSGTTSSSAVTGMAFYSAQNENSYISGIRSAVSQASIGYVADLYEAKIPENAKYARFTIFVPVETYGEFQVLGITKINEEIDSLHDSIDFLDEKINIINDFVPVWESGYREIGGGSGFHPETVIPNAELVTTAIPAQAGDVFYVTGRFWSGYTPSANLFAAVKADGTSAGITPTSVNWTNHVFTCPAGTAYVVCNGKLGEKFDIYKSTIREFESAIQANASAINALTKRAGIFDPVAKKNVVLLGDSITRGVGSSDYSPTGDTIPCSADPAQQRNVGTKSWAAMFGALLTDHYGATVTNNGVSQYTTAKILADIDTLCPTGTDMVILTVGTNDRGGSYSTLNTTVRNLMNAILAKNVQLFVFSPIPLNTTATLGMQKINNIFKAACLDLSVPFFSLFSDFEAFIGMNNLTLSNFFADSLHPNDAGHNLIFNIVRKSLKV